MWKPVEEPWQYAVLDRLPSSIDVTLIEESLKLTPTQRIERMMQLLKTMEALQQAGRVAREKHD